MSIIWDIFDSMDDNKLSYYIDNNIFTINIHNIKCLSRIFKKYKILVS